MWRSIASNALTLFIVILVAVAALVAWGRQRVLEPGPLAEPICLQVERGAIAGGGQPEPGGAGRDHRRADLPDRGGLFRPGG